MRNTLCGVAVISLFVALPLAGCSSEKEAATVQKAPSGPQVVLTTTDAVAWQDVAAEITTVDKAQVVARIAGILTSLSVREGDVVRKGQVIGRIVDSQLGYQSSAYNAQAAAAQAQADQAKAELERVRFLHQNGVYAQARLEQAQAAASAAQAQVRAARAQQAAVGAVAGQGNIVAPSDGRVLTADVPTGSPVSPGLPVVVITSGPTIVRLTMPESLAEKVRPGALVMAGGRTGRVVKVYPAVTSGQVMADVEMANIDNSMIGRRIAAKVETGTRKALLVPANYVTSHYGIDYVTVVSKDGSATQVPVQTAPAVETGKVELLSGVVAGDTIIAPAKGS